MDFERARGFLGSRASMAIRGAKPPPEKKLPELTERLVRGDLDPVARAFSRAYCDAPRFTWAPSEESLGTSVHGRALAIWSDLPRVGTETAPRLESFDIVSFRGMMGSLMLLQPVSDGGDFLYRVYGTDIARFVGVELTGKRLSETTLPAFAKAFFQVTYGAVLRRPEPLLTRHVAPTGFIMATWDRLILPFLDANGAVARFLVVNEPIRATQIDG
jgi:hypothetical protein